MPKVPGVEGVAMQRKDSSGEMASVVAERMPNLSQLRYLPQGELDQFSANHPPGVSTYRPWWPLKLMFSVPATRFATHTCLTSCGSAVERSPSTMFSSSLGKTLPLASHAMQVGGVDGRAKMTGPVISDGASAVTQLSSSSVVEMAGSVVARAVEVGACLSRPDSVAGCFLFFDLFSPLKARGLTMISSNAYSARWPRTTQLDMLVVSFLVARLVATRVPSGLAR